MRRRINGEVLIEVSRRLVDRVKAVERDIGGIRVGPVTGCLGIAIHPDSAIARVLDLDDRGVSAFIKSDVLRTVRIDLCCKKKDKTDSENATPIEKEPTDFRHEAKSFEKET
jgi:hypothetical protein